MLKKVGISRLNYSDIKYDGNGWVNAEEYAPEPFDLVKLKTITKIVVGWFTGDEWYGRRLNDDDKVLKWKRRNEIY